MSLYRKTAIVQLELPSGASAERLPLTSDRAYGVMFTIDGQSYPASYFYSPINDEQWRDFSSRLSDCNVRRSIDATAYRNATFIRGLGQSLYKVLAGLNTQLQAFLDETGTPRRLVIQTTRPELHLLPWGALFSGGGNLLAAADLSVVQSFDNFSATLAVTQSRMNLFSFIGPDTNFATKGSLDLLPPEIVQLASGNASVPDILHVEAHGNKVNNQVGDESANAFGAQYGKTTLALLWSCYSSSADSWGDSPALCLHKQGAALVLSFQAELNVLDASSIAEALYSDVFGPAASRNPETALVHIRADKYLHEFAFANWASMTLFLRCPLDLSALPLNGPRVPAAQWFADAVPTLASAPGLTQNPQTAASGDGVSQFTAEAAQLADRPFMGGGYGGDPGSGAVSALEETGTFAAIRAAAPAQVNPAADSAADSKDPWAAIAEIVRTLQPGSWRSVDQPAILTGAANKLPLSAFGAWRGNVIRLDGGEAPLTLDILKELDLERDDPPSGRSAEGLVWFFNKIAHYGSPLIVWTNSQPRHLEFLKVAGPSPALTFLLLGGTEVQPTIPELVDQNRLDEARAAAAKLKLDDPANPVSEEVLSAAYFASVRGVKPDLARQYLKSIRSFQQWLLLTGNLFSRDKSSSPSATDLLELGGRFLAGASPSVTHADFDMLHRPEDFYRLAMNQPAAASSPRENARAKQELAYLLQQQGQPATAEVFYRLALSDLDACDDSGPGKERDSRWHFALSAVLRDLADLLSSDGCRLDDASALLERAMAIQAYRGMELQLGYSETTAARIALTGCRHTQAIDHAVDAANRMEACANWSGWSEALTIFFDSLAETRETTRMINLAELASKKLHNSNLSEASIAAQDRLFKFEKAKAHWIAGDIVEARDELEDVRSLAPENEKSGMDREIDRLLNFLRVDRPSAPLIAEAPIAAPATGSIPARSAVTASAVTASAVR